MSETRAERSFSLPAAPADRYGDTLTEVRHLHAPKRFTTKLLSEQFGLDAKRAALLASPGRLNRNIATDPGLLIEARRLYATTVQRGEGPVHIVEAYPDRPIMSGQPFALAVRFANFGDAPLAVASVEVQWHGEPFTVEAFVETGEREGVAPVEFDEEHTLPVGPVAFQVTLYRADGAESRFRAGAYVLPSNPLALAIGPAGARVTGSYSARGDYEPGSDSFTTTVEVTISNGDARAVAMDTRTEWSFWNGSVGSGTRIEGGTFAWNGGISAPAYGLWRGTVSFSSPAGSGIYDTYKRKEDMAIEIVMRAADGRVLRSQITARVMLVYGVNIIKVGDFTATEHADLYASVDLTRDIYEDRDITIGDVRRWIIRPADAGGYTIVDSETEYRDMLKRWSCANNDVDVFVLQDFNWSTFNGYAGGIPGPASKGGDKDGVAVDKTGYTDGSGNARLTVSVLGPLIGHEVGHYLGLEHQETTNNLMRSNTGNRGRLLDYDQYRKIFPHGFVEYL